MDIVFQPSALLDWCQRIYGPGQRLILSDYSYVVDFGDVAANARLTRQIQITQNADFVLLGFDGKYNYLSPPPSGSILVSDSATGEQFSNSAVFCQNLFAALDQGQPIRNPLNLPYPRWIGGNTVISIQYNNTSETLGFELTLRGFLIRKLA